MAEDLLSQIERSAVQTQELVRRLRQQMSGIVSGTVNGHTLDKRDTTKLPEETRARMERMFAEGASLRDVAKACGVGVTSAGRYKKRWAAKKR